MNGEDAVDGHARNARILGVPGMRRHLVEGGAQLVEAGARAARYAHDGRLREWRAAETVANLIGHERAPFLVDEVGLGHGHNGVAHAEQLEHGEMLDRLRHDAVVGGDDDERDVDARCARHHVAHKALVTRHVDHAERASARQHELGEPELDGDAASLLLGEAVGIGAREGAHERRFAVVDVPGGSQNEVRLGGAHRASS